MPRLLEQRRLLAKTLCRDAFDFAIRPHNVGSWGKSKGDHWIRALVTDQLVGVGRHRHPGVALKVNDQAVMALRHRHRLLLHNWLINQAFLSLPSFASSVLCKGSKPHES